MAAEPTMFLAMLIVILFAIGIHEYCHALFADMAGDPTPRMMGRVTLNPIAHLDPIGTIFILMSLMSGFGIGWGKPVVVDPSKMRNPRWDHFISVAAGPLSNLLQATLFAMAARFMAASGSLVQGSFASMLVIAGILINVSLFLFNLIPLGPLDGHWLVGTFLPERVRLRWYIWNRTVGGFLLLGLIILGNLVPQLDVIGRVLAPGARVIVGLLLGRQI